MLRMRRLVPVIICASYGLLLVAWAISNPPFAGADESAHYQRAVGVGNGQLIGAKAGVKAPEGASPETASMFEWANDATRYVDIRGGVGGSRSRPADRRSAGAPRHRDKA
jgi:hypothetical protein